METNRLMIGFLIFSLLISGCAVNGVSNQINATVTQFVNYSNNPNLDRHQFKDYNASAQFDVNQNQVSVSDYFFYLKGKFSISNVMQTGSMIPTIGYNSTLIERQYQGEDLKIGDIIIFSSNYSNNGENKTFRAVHRIIGFDGDKYVTKGDNNFFGDPVHPAKSDIQYVVVGVIFT